MKPGWEVRRLGEVCALITRGIAPKYIESGGVRVVNQKCVRDHAVNFALARRHDDSAKAVAPDRLLRAGDGLVNSTGEGTLGRVAMLRDEPDEPTTVDTHVTIVRPRPGMFHPPFFGLVLASIEDEIAASGEGASGQTELSRMTLRDRFEVGFPTDLAEQRRIVEVLDEAFAGLATATANAEQTVAAARELLTTFMAAVFTGASDEHEADRTTSGWPTRHLKEVAQLCLGKMLDKQKNRGELQPYLRNANVRWFGFDLDDVSEMPFEAHERDRYTAVNGDVLICEGGYPGRAAVWRDDAPIYFQKAVHRVRFHEPARADWLVYYLWYLDQAGALREHFNGTGILHFTGQALAKFPLPFPPLTKQNRLVAELDEFSQQIADLEAMQRRKLTLLAELKQSLLHRAFTGELA